MPTKPKPIPRPPQPPPPKAAIAANAGAHLTGRASNSDALDSTSPEYLKPLARYEKLHSSDEIVWNVFDRQVVAERVSVNPC
jgi:hypothetical protein